MNNGCGKDCMMCELEGCPFTLRVSLDLDQELMQSKTKTARDLAVKRYNESPKRKKVQARYINSEKGREASRKNTKIYYDRHREEILQKKKDMYNQNKEYFKQKRHEYYLKSKLKIQDVV